MHRSNSSHFGYTRHHIRTCFLAVTAIIALSTMMINSSPVLAKSNPRYASIVIDSDTGMILHQRYADKSLHPASLTKVMTLLLTFDALKSGKAHMNDRVIISRRAANAVPSKLGIPAGKSILLQDAIYALTIKSANDIAVAMAEHIGGSESNFARMMTRKARKIGMKRTIFRNASGLHNSRQVSTARDMSILARTVINDYPEYYRYFSKKSFTYDGKTYRNHNRLMKTYKGMDGMKTGYIQASGFNLVASAVRNNRRIIGVVFGGRTAKTRNRHMAKLMDSGFAKLNEIRVASAKIPLPPRKPGILLAMASLNNLAPAAGESSTKWTILNPALESGMFRKLIGEGDYDLAASKRIETGLIAISAHKRNRILKTLSNKKNWAIQIGAFKSRLATDLAIDKTINKLPARYASANPVIAPLKTKDGWLFRARLNGYSKTEAIIACGYLNACLTIAPQSR